MDDLSVRAIEWVQRAARSPVTSVTALHGATTASLYALDLSRGGRLILKWFTRREFVAEAPDRAVHEAAVLGHLEATAVPAPRLVAVDPRGDDTGCPAVLMTEVSGDRYDWAGGGGLVAQAHLAIAVHGVSPIGGWVYRQFNRDLPLTPPVWSRHPSVWDEAFAVHATPAPRTAAGFIHRDYHPGNMVWQGGEISGIVDWLDGCTGPFAVDLAHNRTNLAGHLGLDAADAFLCAYLEEAGDDAWHPAWDVIASIERMPYHDGQRAVDSWPGEGSHHGRRQRSHADALLVRAMAEL